MNSAKLEKLRNELSLKPSLNLCDEYERAILFAPPPKIKNPLDNLLSSALKDFSRGNFSKAAAILKRALKIKPAFLPSMRLEMEVLAVQKKFSELEKLVAAKCFSPLHYAALFEVLLKGNFAKETEKFMLIGLKKFSRTKNLPLYLKAAVFQRHLDTVFSKKIHRLGFIPKPEDVYFRIAEIHLNAGHTQKMRKFLTEYVKNAEIKRENSDQMFEAFCLLGNFSKAFSCNLEHLLNEHLDNETEISEGINPFSKLRDKKYAKFLSRQMTLYLQKKPEDERAKFYRFLLTAQFSDIGPKYAEQIRKLKLKNKKLAAFMNHTCGLVFLKKQKFDSALSCFKKALSGFPESEMINGKIAEALLRAGNEKKSLKYIRQVLNHLPRPGLKAWEGELLLITGRYRQARRVLQQALEENCVFAYCWLGATLFKLGSPFQALNYINQAIKFNPSDIEAKIWRSEININLGNFARAMSDIDEIISIEKTNFWAHVNKIDIFCRKGDAKQALRYFRKISPQIKSKILSGAGCGKKHLDTAKIKKAIEEIKTIAKGNRRSEEYMQNLQKTLLPKTLLPKTLLPKTLLPKTLPH